MIDTNGVILTEISIMQDNLTAITLAFINKSAHEDYIDEKLSHIERCAEYLRHIVDDKIKEKVNEQTTR